MCKITAFAIGLSVSGTDSVDPSGRCHPCSKGWTSVASRSVSSLLSSASVAAVRMPRSSRYSRMLPPAAASRAMPCSASAVTEVAMWASHGCRAQPVWGHKHDPTAMLWSEWCWVLVMEWFHKSLQLCEERTCLRSLNQGHKRNNKHDTTAAEITLEITERCKIYINMCGMMVSEGSDDQLVLLPAAWALDESAPFLLLSRHASCHPTVAMSACHRTTHWVRLILQRCCLRMIQGLKVQKKRLRSLSWSTACQNICGTFCSHLARSWCARRCWSRIPQTVRHLVGSLSASCTDALCRILARGRNTKVCGGLWIAFLIWSISTCNDLTKDANDSGLAALVVWGTAVSTLVSVWTGGASLSWTGWLWEEALPKTCCGMLGTLRSALSWVYLRTAVLVQRPKSWIKASSTPELDKPLGLLSIRALSGHRCVSLGNDGPDGLSDFCFEAARPVSSGKKGNCCPLPLPGWASSRTGASLC